MQATHWLARTAAVRVTDPGSIDGATVALLTYACSAGQKRRQIEKIGGIGRALGAMAQVNHTGGISRRVTYTLTGFFDEALAKHGQIRPIDVMLSANGLSNALRCIHADTCTTLRRKPHEVVNKDDLTMRP